LAALIGATHGYFELVNAMIVFTYCFYCSSKLKITNWGSWKLSSYALQYKYPHFIRLCI